MSLKTNNSAENDIEKASRSKSKPEAPTTDCNIFFNSDK